MSVTSYNEGQVDLRNAISNLNQKMTVLKDNDQLQDVQRFQTTRNETHALYKKHETIYTLTGIVTVLVVLFTSHTIFTSTPK
jgi:hypothetical protein